MVDLKPAKRYYWPSGQWAYILWLEMVQIIVFFGIAHPYISYGWPILFVLVGGIVWWFDQSIDLFLRRCFTGTFGIISIVWGIMRYQDQVSWELLLAEMLSISAGGLLFLPRINHQMYFLLIGAVLIVCGACFPFRQEFLYGLPLVAIGLCILMFYRRIYGLAGSVQLRYQFKWNYWAVLWLVVIIGMGGLFTFIFFPYYPQGDKVSELGLFLIENQSTLNLTQRNWLARRSRSSSSVELITDKVPLDISSFNGKYSTLGRDLVMRVQTPLPTYWIARIYDVYTGKTWKSSEAMELQNIAFSFSDYQHLARCYHPVKIEKWFSPVLYTPFLKGGTHIVQGSPVKREYLFYVERLAPGQNYPSLPFNYIAKSFLAKGDHSPLAKWYEELPPEHYLQLPPEYPLKYQRIYRFAKQLIGASTDPYEQTMLIRNYLRQYYRYQLGVPPPNAEEDMVNYFLFTTQSGHCEYFAAAMTVLARCVGIPARLVSGFSPGEYNPITREYEIYEYHAHAWSQVFIPGKGWLTMDATPDDATPIQTREKTILQKLLSGGAVQDPFSKEWRVSCPELVSGRVRLVKLQEEVQNRIIEHHRLILNIFDMFSKKKEDGWVGRETNNSELPNSREQKRKVRELRWYDYDPKEDAEEEMYLRIPWYYRVYLNSSYMLKNGLAEFRQWINNLPISWVVDTLVASILLLIVIYLIPILMAMIREHRLWKSSVKMLERARSLIYTDPHSAILIIYKAIKNMLTVARLPRLPGESLAEYATALHYVDPKLGKNLIYLFNLYEAVEYSPRSISSNEVESGLRCAEAVYSYLQERMKKGASPIVTSSGKHRDELVKN